ncbi:Isy1-like splicing factor [Pseudovirgaria hyperparasitica]|uniref:Isy1-like splicing factor n=1 Tax=Pseudovirgaria hyperparasitica TaxID=470096 RepID=A0A6A6WMU8_9PEZI|nr:Isy1-like splicing factor [Pseudovirgaria hyperparasitica]KAF2763426.1 Isy1-like splicing factor [Pseudovirgaria hyperparasitica]
MARNSEKAQSMLFRFRAQQAADLGILDINRTRRPKAITTIDKIPVAEKWRGQVLKEISRKVSKIQEDSLSDYQIRDLNDEINKLMREKHMWEIQIRNLGGPNYMRGGRVLDEEGREVVGGEKGYRYFGRARTLPGVAELFAAAAAPPTSHKHDHSRATLSRLTDASYYGYNLDEEDGTLLAYEAKKEDEAYRRLMRDADAEHNSTPSSSSARKRKGVDAEWVELPGDAGDGIGWNLPDLDQVQEELVERRRRRLLDKLG